MKQAYFAISLSNRPHFDQEIESLALALENFGFKLLVFVDHYHFAPEQAKAMMQQAFLEMDKSELLIVEMSKKAVGVGIETGYAFAKNIPIIYLKKHSASYSTTTAGCAHSFINYKDVPDLIQQFNLALKTLEAV